MAVQLAYAGTHKPALCDVQLEIKINRYFSIICDKVPPRQLRTCLISAAEIN
jgi:hypothetical protein